MPSGFASALRNALLAVAVQGSIAIAAGACTVVPEPGPTPSPVSLNRAEQVQIMLQEAAGSSRLGAWVEGAPAGARGREVWVGDEPLVVYELIGSTATEQILAELRSNGGSGRIWVLDRLLIEYRGSDGGTVLLLSGLLGDPQIGPSAAGEEPYPPAVSAAIAVVAELADANPAEVQVLSFEPRTWPDRCLGMPDSGEACAEQAVSGWRIEFEVGGTRYQAHSDSFGDEVRVR